MHEVRGSSPLSPSYFSRAIEDEKGAPTNMSRAATEQGAASTLGSAGGYRSHTEGVTEEPSPLSPTIRLG